MMAHVELLELKMIGGVRQVVVYNVAMLIKEWTKQETEPKQNTKQRKNKATEKRESL